MGIYCTLKKKKKKKKSVISIFSRQSNPLSYIFHYFIISVSVHVCVYDVGCFVDVLASRSGYSWRKPSVPMIAILLAPWWVCR